jgi:hypothetical protein
MYRVAARSAPGVPAATALGDRYCIAEKTVILLTGVIVSHETISEKLSDVKRCETMISIVATREGSTSFC